jgi:hypothetical protein
MGSLLGISREMSVLQAVHHHQQSSSAAKHTALRMRCGAQQHLAISCSAYLMLVCMACMLVLVNLQLTPHSAVQPYVMLVCWVQHMVVQVARSS